MAEVRECSNIKPFNAMHNVFTVLKNELERHLDVRFFSKRRRFDVKEALAFFSQGSKVTY